MTDVVAGSEPVAEEPVAEEPVAEEPVAEETAAEETAAEEPVAEEPVAEEPVAAEEPKRRTKVIGRFPGETSAISLVWAVLDRASARWRGLTMTPVGTRPLPDLRRSLLDPPRELRPPPASTSYDTDPADPITATA